MGSHSPQRSASPAPCELNLQLMLSYESLDYDECASSVAAAEKLAQSANYKRARNFANWGVYSVVGMVTGTAAFAIAVCVGWLSELKFNTTSYFLLESSLGRATWQVSVLLCTVTFYANRAHNLTRSP
jgi:hypothetical protein